MTRARHPSSRRSSLAIDGHQQLVEGPPVVQTGETVAHRELALLLPVLDEGHRGGGLVGEDLQHSARGRVERPTGSGEHQGPQGAVPGAEGNREERSAAAGPLVEDQDGHPVLVPRNVIEKVGLLGAAQDPGRPGALVEGHLALDEVRRPAEAGLHRVAGVEVVGHDHCRPLEGDELAGRTQEQLAHLGLPGDRGQALGEGVDRLELGVELLATERRPGPLDRLGGEGGEAREESGLGAGKGLDLDPVGQEHADDHLPYPDRHRQEGPNLDLPPVPRQVPEQALEVGGVERLPPLHDEAEGIAAQGGGAVAEEGIGPS